MIALDDPPPGVRDRWKMGAKMCTDWGIPVSGASVWRLYRSYVLEWRFYLAQESGADASDPESSLEEKTTRMVERRSLEILTHPQAPPDVVLRLARLKLRRETLELRCQILQLARDKHADSKLQLLDRALDAFIEETNKCPAARDLFLQVAALLNPDSDLNEATPDE